MNIHTLYLLLLQEKEITVRTVDKPNHDNLRVRLCRIHSTHKATMEGIGYSDPDTLLSVSGIFDVETGQSNFVLKEKKQKKEYEIVNITKELR